MIINFSQDSKINKQTLHFLDGLRGLAALYVVIGHARWLLWEGYKGYLENSSSYSFIEKFFVYFLSIFKYGHEVVLIFFILSGFLIHNNNAYKLTLFSTTSISFLSYISRRAIRILPPLIASFLLTYLLDKIGIALGFTIYFQSTLNEQINQNIFVHLDYSTLLGNLTFLQTIYVPVWGSNGPLWSLMFEWWFYLLYPLFFIINKRNPSFAFMVVVCCTILCWTFVSPPLLLQLVQCVGSYWLCWILGACLADAYHNRIMLSLRILTSLIFLSIPYLLFATHIPTGAISDTALSIILCGFMAGLLWLNKNRPVFLLPLTRLQWLGRCSYTLYVSHFSILVFLNGLLLSVNSNKLPSTFIFMILGISIVLSIAYLLHFILEIPFLKKV